MSDTVRFVLVGDVMLGRLVNRMLRVAPPEYPWGDVLPILRSADAFVCNLECVISDRGEPWPGKIFTFRSDRKNVAVLEQAGVTAVSLANNHTLDYGSDALADCLSALTELGIGAAGAGQSLQRARAPAVFPVGALHAELVAFTDNDPSWEANGATPGVFYVPLDPPDERFAVLLDIVREAAWRADLVIISAHWGPNWGEEPLASHVEAAHRLIDAGADVVFGHSAHIFRGVEFYRDKAILYSCGDFVDDYAVDEVERNDHSFVFNLEFTRTALQRIVLVPTVIHHFQARLAQEPARTAILDRMQELSARLGRVELRASDQVLEMLPPGQLPLAAP
jgi:poly-gamma-glutamate synthesis protein (capsule biosynthesis protein)